MLHIMIVGCGNIAHLIFKKSKNIAIDAVFDINEQRAKEFSKLTGAKICKSIEDLLKQDCTLVVEAASPHAVVEIGEKVLKARKDLMIMSVGGLADKDFYEEMLSLASKLEQKIYIPSGAIGGLDALSAASIGKIESILIETTKPASSLPVEVKEKKKIFEGTPDDAIKQFPKNINVAVTLSLIGRSKNVIVKIVADPNAHRNKHNITIRGDVGTITMCFDNVPSENEATSLLAGYSAVALLERLSSPLQF